MLSWKDLLGDHTRTPEHCTGFWKVQVPHIILMVLVLILAFVLNARITLTQRMLILTDRDITKQNNWLISNIFDSLGK